ncbi:MAG: hypothetical protein LC793_14740, partial [Thermomicrobia bacterium]|nr:hypothetical protein [Thermomicrobia bacterium]MCA1724145.1 hypothetical protein [Thermomicrobia bacterium]
MAGNIHHPAVSSAKMEHVHAEVERLEGFIRTAHEDIASWTEIRDAVAKQIRLLNPYSAVIKKKLEEKKAWKHAIK